MALPNSTVWRAVMSYSREFQLATERSLEWTLISKPLAIHPKAVQMDNIVSLAIDLQQERGEETIGDCFSMCLNFETRLLAMDHLPLPAITIGNVDVRGR